MRNRFLPYYLSWQRVVSCPFRCLPNFLIIGAQKCGTTSLFDALTDSEAVLGSCVKECQYFLQPRRTSWRYRAYFPTRGQCRRRARLVGYPLPVGEATPYYLFHPEVPARVAALLPDAKLIVLLRDPVARAFSHYRHSVRFGLEPLGFEAALEAEADRLVGSLDLTPDAARRLNDPLRNYSYFARGLYAEQLRRWFGYFDHSQFLVLISEMLFREPQVALDRVARFLEIRALKSDTFPRSNVGDGSREMPPAARNRLLEAYAQPTHELEELLAVRTGWQCVQ